jgi:senataxin
LTALQLGSSHAILVGDPNQLPATIFSLTGRFTKFDRRLFQRLEESGHIVHLLNVQYRNHPKISSFPRRIFYDGSLLDGPNVIKPDYGGPLRTAIEMKFPKLQPLTIFDLKSTEERECTSLSNSEEAYLALHIFCSLNAATNGVLLEQRFVCVITPYSQQVSLLNKIFKAKLGHHFSRGLVEISTIDAFQGNEREIVIFSAVRATNKGGGIGNLCVCMTMSLYS